MLIPSLYVSGDKERPWSVARATVYGAAIGTLAALFKTLSPLHKAITLGGQSSGNLMASIPEIACVALGFAVLCAGAAALRNFLARRVIWSENR